MNLINKFVIGLAQSDPKYGYNKNNNLNDADLELLIYFDCMDLFTRQDFLNGTYTF